MIVCAGEIESFSFATPIGIGLVNSAINLSRIAIMNPPEFIIFIGTAGSYGKHNIFDIVESRTASNIEHSFLLNSAYTPIDNVISTADDVSHETIVNSSNYITTDSEISKKYLDKNIYLENMEFYSVMAVAKEFSIPVGGIFCVTNYCNENAHKDFLANRIKAMKILEEYLKNRGVIK